MNISWEADVAGVSRASCRSALDRRPVDPLGQVGRAEFDQSAALDRLAPVAAQRQPIDRALVRIDDQKLIDAVSGG